ncbi:Kinase, AGC Akt [Spironucleus salmonicida]|uniref:Kinase, AGC Akt n=1 Tax=Spironucleus salmonicida TaxID=348837 RepID=V6LD69_9EUKA|nr:Kinase, AGC Akt [Spironucleus salmonicida]|eukprot:EST42422.1 Kinase, AGC Akt [Spironucleus salmonicida]
MHPLNFLLTRTSKFGKKTQKTLSLAPNAVSSASQKFDKKASQIHGLHVSRTNKNAFAISLIEPVIFETDEADQVAQIIEAWRELKLGQIFYDDEILTVQGEEPPQTPKIAQTQPISQQTSQQNAPLTVQKIQPQSPPLNHGNANPLAMHHLSKLPRFPKPPNSAEKLMKPQNFELVASVGKGSFGQVFLVRRVDDNRFFAMKVLKKRAVIDRKQLNHLRAEHTILQSVTHPYCVKLHHSFQTRTRLFFILDFALGGEMFHHLKKQGQFPEILSIFYLAEAVLAFEYLHEFDIVFRDTKPENLLLDGYGHVVLTDFGLAKCGVSADSTDSIGYSTKTFCGTPDYLSAEIVASVAHGKAVDVWSVGALLYEMLVGQAPFSYGNGAGTAPNRSELYRRILRGNVIFPAHVSEPARQLILACMQRRPKDRPTMAELRDFELFQGVNWEKLARREVPPPQKIKIEENCIKAVEGRLAQNSGDSIYKYIMPDNLVAHFDPRFTQEPPTLAPSTAQDGVTAEEDKNFREFNWTSPDAFRQ